MIELTLRVGRYGERVETVAIPLDPDLARDLTEPVELSDEPFSLMLASPGMFGGKGDAVTIRRKKFALRRDMAKRLANQIEDKLMEMFGVDDETDGYRRLAAYHRWRMGVRSVAKRLRAPGEQGDHT